MNRLAEVIDQAVRRVLKEELGNVVSPFIYATFVAAESVDSNLSEVTFADGGTARFVPKLASAGSLSAGNTLLCVKGKGVPLTILGRVVGKTTLANAYPDESPEDIDVDL